MTGDTRQTWGLITDILDVLEKHGYHRGDNQHTGRAIGLIADLARIYEGTREAPVGAYVARTPASPQAAAEPVNPAAGAGAATIAAAEMKTILAALDEAADHKRARAANCADCADQSCGSCQFRLETALAYDSLTARLAVTAGQPARQASPGGLRGSHIQPPAGPGMEAGQ